MNEERWTADDAQCEVIKDNVRKAEERKMTRWMSDAYGAAVAIQRICDEVREEQTVFLALFGFTWEQAQALSDDERVPIQAAWAAHQAIKRARRNA